MTPMEVAKDGLSELLNGLLDFFFVPFWRFLDFGCQARRAVAMVHGRCGLSTF